MQDTIAPPLVDVYDLADALELPAQWLKTESKAQRIPYLQVGRKSMFSIVAVRETLYKRAADSNNITNPEPNATVQAGAD